MCSLFSFRMRINYSVNWLVYGVPCMPCALINWLEWQSSSNNALVLIQFWNHIGFYCHFPIKFDSNWHSVNLINNWLQKVCWTGRTLIANLEWFDCYHCEKRNFFHYRLSTLCTSINLRWAKFFIWQFRKLNEVTKRWSHN